MTEQADRSQRKAVVLGASGFIGVNLAAALAAHGYRVVCFSRSASPHWPAGSEAILGDIANPPGELVDAMRGAVVFHLVSSTRPSASTAGVADEIAQNVLPTVRLLDATIDAGCRWVFISSGGTVYGQTDLDLIGEDHPTRPISSYGVVKLALEGYFGIYRALHGIDYVVARLANPYGPHQSAAKGQGLVAALLDRMSRGDAVQIWGDGGNVRDYIYIDDATEALISAAEKGLSGEIYNVGSGKGTSVSQLIDAVARELGRQPLLIRHRERGMDVRRNVLDVTKLGMATGWKPSRTLGEGISLAWQLHLKQ